MGAAVDLRLVVIEAGSTTASDRRRLVEIVDRVNSQGHHVHVLYDPLGSLRPDSKGHASTRAKDAPRAIMAIRRATPCSPC